MIRPGKEEYLLDIARTVAKRSTCPDMKVGCVIATVDGFILSTGYNGSPRGWAHCLEDKDGKCLGNGPEHRVVHAEANAVAAAARQGVSLNGSIAYVNYEPCLKCEMLLTQAGVRQIVSVK